MVANRLNKYGNCGCLSKRNRQIKSGSKTMNRTSFNLAQAKISQRKMNRLVFLGVHVNILKFR